MRLGLFYGSGGCEDIYKVYGFSHSEECEAISKTFL